MPQDLEKDIVDIKEKLSSFGKKLESVYYALVGNAISKDGGLVADIINHQEQIKRLTERVERVEAKESKRQVYVRIIWAMGAAILTLIIDHISK